MFCRKCGTELPEGGKFCPSCGTAVEQSNSSNVEGNSSPNPVDEQNRQPTPENSAGMKCPKCGCEYCQPHYKQETTSTGKNYSCLQGGLGFLLTGPFGLLCGLCGQGVKTNSTSTLVWICPNCGKEFRSRDDIYKDRLSSYKICIGFLIAGMLFLDLTVFFDIWLFDMMAVTYLGILFLIVMAVVPIIVFLCVKNAPQNNYGVDFETLYTQEEKAAFRADLKKWMTPLIILVGLFILLIVVLLIRIAL